MSNFEFSLSEHMLLINAAGYMAKLYADLAETDILSKDNRATFALQSVAYQALHLKLEECFKDGRYSD